MSAKSSSAGKTPDPQVDAALPREAGLGESNGHAAGAPLNVEEHQQPLEQDDEAILLQQVMRFRNPDGSETIYATLRGEFAPGERGITLYVGFCPPFAQIPVVEAEAMEGPPTRVTVAQVQNNGAQIDVELERPESEMVQVTIEVAALPAMPATE
jgi:hypothetical protein